MIKLIVFDAIQYVEFFELNESFRYYLDKLIPNIEYDYDNQELKVGDIIITPDI